MQLNYLQVANLILKVDSHSTFPKELRKICLLILLRHRIECGLKRNLGDEYMSYKEVTYDFLVDYYDPLDMMFRGGIRESSFLKAGVKSKLFVIDDFVTITYFDFFRGAYEFRFDCPHFYDILKRYLFSVQRQTFRFFVAPQNVQSAVGNAPIQVGSKAIFTLSLLSITDGIVTFGSYGLFHIPHTLK